MSNIALQEAGTAAKYFVMLPHLVGDLVEPVPLAVYKELLRWAGLRRKPSQNKMAEMCQMSAAAFSRALVTLEEVGLIAVWRNSGEPSHIDLLDIWVPNVLTYERPSRALSERLLDARQMLRERAREFVEGRQPPAPPSVEQTEDQASMVYIRADGADTALAALFSGISPTGRDMTEMQQCVYRVAGTPEQIRRWPEWMRQNWPTTGITPHNFKIYFPQMVQAEASTPSPTKRQPSTNCPACRGAGFYTLYDEQNEPLRTVSPCDRCRGAA